MLVFTYAKYFVQRNFKIKLYHLKSYHCIILHYILSVRYLLLMTVFVYKICDSKTKGVEVIKVITVWKKCEKIKKIRKVLSRCLVSDSNDPKVNHDQTVYITVLFYNAKHNIYAIYLFKKMNNLNKTGIILKNILRV